MVLPRKECRGARWTTTHCCLVLGSTKRYSEFCFTTLFVQDRKRRINKNSIGITDMI